MLQAASYLFEVGAEGGVRGLRAGLPPHLVVPDDDDEVAWLLPADGGECAHVHEQAAVAVE